MRKRKRGEEEDDEVGEQQELPPTEPLKTKSPSKKGKSKMAELFKRPLATSLTKRNIATMSRKYRGVASSP
jgi:hypothetical protein